MLHCSSTVNINKPIYVFTQEINTQTEIFFSLSIFMILSTSFPIKYMFLYCCFSCLEILKDTLNVENSAKV